MAESSLDAVMAKAKSLYTSGDYQGAWDAVMAMNPADKRAALENPDHKLSLSRIRNQALVMNGAVEPADLGLDSGAGPSSPTSDTSSAMASPPDKPSAADVLYPRNKKGKVTF